MVILTLSDKTWSQAADKQTKNRRKHQIVQVMFHAHYRNYEIIIVYMYMTSDNCQYLCQPLQWHLDCKPCHNMSMITHCHGMSGRV